MRAENEAANYVETMPATAKRAERALSICILTNWISPVQCAVGAVQYPVHWHSTFRYSWMMGGKFGARIDSSWILINSKGTCSNTLNVVGPNALFHLNDWILTAFDDTCWQTITRALLICWTFIWKEIERETNIYYTLHKHISTWLELCKPKYLSQALNYQKFADGKRRRKTHFSIKLICNFEMGSACHENSTPLFAPIHVNYGPYICDIDEGRQ